MRAATLVLLDQPRTAAEVTARLGLHYNATRILLREGRAVHCGPVHYVRADLKGKFEDRPRPVWVKPTPPVVIEARNKVLAALVRPCGAGEISELTGLGFFQVRYHLRVLRQEGLITRKPKPGRDGWYLYELAAPDAQPGD